MAWVRIDDHFDEHPKLARVGPLGWGVWLAGLAYCNRNLTDGFIPWAKAETLASFCVTEEDGKRWRLGRTSGMVGEDIDADWIIGLLLDAGLWEDAEGGYQIHDYEQYQPSRQDVLEERDAARERMRKARENKLRRSPEVRPNIPRSSRYPVPDPDPDPVPNDTLQTTNSRDTNDHHYYQAQPVAAAAANGSGDAIVGLGDVEPATLHVNGSDGRPHVETPSAAESAPVDVAAAVPEPSTPPRASTRKRQNAEQPPLSPEVLDALDTLNTRLARLKGWDPTSDDLYKIGRDYGHLDLEEAAIGMRDWLKRNPRRQCSVAFAINWLKRAAAASAAGIPTNGARASPARAPNGRTPADLSEFDMFVKGASD